MAQKLTIEFQPKGDKHLLLAMKQLDHATNVLKGTTSVYKQELRDMGLTSKQVNKFLSQQNKTSLFGVKNNRLLSNSLATLRSKMLIVAFGAAIITKAFKALFEATMKQEKAERKLEAQLGKVNTALLNQASSLQKVTEFGDEAVIEVQSLIAAFTKDEEKIKSLTVATLDLAAAKGMDLKAAADLVGKSFGSSTNALVRYGIQVNGAVGSSQRLESLTENIAELFGGQARASADTLSGSIEQMKNAIGDANEAVGVAFAPVIQKLAGFLTEAAGAAREFFLEFSETPFERNIRQIEELGGNADEFKKKLLEAQKIDLERGVALLPDHLKESSSVLDIMNGQNEVMIDRLKRQHDAMDQLKEDGHDIVELRKMADVELVFGATKAQHALIMSNKEYAEGILKNVDYWSALVAQGKEDQKVNSEILKIVLEYEATVARLLELQPEEEGGFFAKMFGKFSEPGEMENLLTNVDKFVDALSGVANAYDQVKMQQINQAKQAELDSVKGIRNERIRTKKLEEIEAKYAEKTRKHKEKMKTVKVMEAISNTALGATKAWSDPGGFLGMALAAMIVAQGAMQIKLIKAQKYQYGGMVGGRRHSQGGTMIEAEQGEFVMSRDAVDAVGIENLNRMNTGLGGGGGSTIVINNPILGKDMIEDEIVPQIQEALRRGGDIGV